MLHLPALSLKDLPSQAASYVFPSSVNDLILPTFLTAAHLFATLSVFVRKNVTAVLKTVTAVQKTVTAVMKTGTAVLTDNVGNSIPAEWKMTWKLENSP